MRWDNTKMQTLLKVNPDVYHISLGIVILSNSKCLPHICIILSPIFVYISVYLYYTTVYINTFF